MASAAQKQPYMLISLFEHLFEQRAGRKLTLNKYREKWGFQDMIDSVGYDRAVEIIKFYFSTDNQWTTSHLFNVFDKLDDSLRKRDEDRVKRAKLREETRLRMEEQVKHES